MCTILTNDKQIEIWNAKNITLLMNFNFYDTYLSKEES